MQKSTDPMTSMKKMGEDLPWDLSLKKPLVIMSLKATGFDPTVDRVIEIACIKLDVSGSRTELFYQLNPERPISPEATKLHSISDKDVKEWSKFATVASDLKSYLTGCDLAGHRLESFDLPLLIGEFKRKRLSFPLETINLLDIGAISNRFEPNINLGTLYLQYYRGKFPVAQSTVADANAATDILLAQTRRYKDLSTDMQALHMFMHPEHSAAGSRGNPRGTPRTQSESGKESPTTPKRDSPTTRKRGDSVSLDPDGKIAWRNGEAIFTFGKYKGQSIEDVAEQNPGYLEWIAQRGGPGGFSATVVRIVNAALRGDLPDSLEGYIAEFSLNV